MSDNAINKESAPILALLLTALTAPAAELAVTPAQLAARFGTTKFTLRADLQAPRATLAAAPQQSPFDIAPGSRSETPNPLTATITMNPARKKSLPVHFVLTPILTLPINTGEIRQHGVTPLLIKSIRAQMSATDAVRADAAL